MTELKNENRSSDWWMLISNLLKKTEVESKVHKNETDLIEIGRASCRERVLRLV